MFRDTTLAHQEKEKALLEDKLDAEHLARVRAEKALALYKDKEDKEKKEHEAYLAARYSTTNNGNSRSQFLAGLWNIVKWPFQVVKISIDLARKGRPGAFLFVLAVLAVIGFFTYAIIHQEFYALRDGIVTGKDYTPGHNELNCNHPGIPGPTCIAEWHSPSWAITLTYRGKSSSWTVDEPTYMSLHYGQWWCARDSLHTEPCVPQTDLVER